MSKNNTSKEEAFSTNDDNTDRSDEEEIEFIEESSESEPEFDCNSWDDDCRTLSQNFPINSITGCHLMATCDNDPQLRPKKKPKLTYNIQQELIDSVKELEEKWNNDNAITNQYVEIIVDPFKVFIVNNLLDNQNLLKELIEELYSVYFNMRSMDLYEFFQSKDLQFLISSESIKQVYEFLKGDLMKWVADITGYELTHISATFSLYSNTDYLLLHDDQREDRRVAFILYLTGEDEWRENDGGALQLFDRDDSGHPRNVVKNILPGHNQLIFFPVSNYSYHQVAEVTSLNKYRLSLNGWFHTKTPPTFITPIYQPMENSLYSKHYKPSKTVDIDLESWIHENYLSKKSMKFIQSHIEENSEISLTNFIKQNAFKEVSNSLNDVNWQHVGPGSRYSYEVADLSSLPYEIERFLDLFQSTQMFKLLQNYTELELDKSTATMKLELQKWTPGSYALLTDYDWKERNELDLILQLGCTNSSDVIGARTHYVTIEDEIQNALITIEPEENNLNIVYRDSARFTKYYSKQSRCKCFYMLICSYSE